MRFSPKSIHSLGKPWRWGHVRSWTGIWKQLLYCKPLALPRRQVLCRVSSNSLFPHLPLKLLLEKLWNAVVLHLRIGRRPPYPDPIAIWAKGHSVLPWLSAWQRSRDAFLQSVQTVPYVTQGSSRVNSRDRLSGERSRAPDMNVRVRVYSLLNDPGVQRYF